MTVNVVAVMITLIGAATVEVIKYNKNKKILAKTKFYYNFIARLFITNINALG